MSALLFIVLAALGLGLVMRFIIIPSASTMPDNLGVTDGRFAACPGTPNCASTQSQPDDYGYTEPLAFTGDAQAAFEAALAIVRNKPNSTIVTSEAPYLHATFASNFWHFIDDFELYVDEAAGVIHMRSAARLGQDDLKANPKRLQALRQQIEQSLPVAAETA